MTIDSEMSGLFFQAPRASCELHEIWPFTKSAVRWCWLASSNKSLLPAYVLWYSLSVSKKSAWILTFVEKILQFHLSRTIWCSFLHHPFTCTHISLPTCQWFPRTGYAAMQIYANMTWFVAPNLASSSPSFWDKLWPCPTSCDSGSSSSCLWFEAGASVASSVTFPEAKPTLPYALKELLAIYTILLEICLGCQTSSTTM